MTIIDFWATWCGPCVESIPHWNELLRHFASSNVQFLAVTDENESLVKRFLKRTTIHSTVGIEGPGQSLRDLYGITGIPTTVLVNKEGKVAAVTHPTYLKPEHISELIRTGKCSVESKPGQANTDTPDANAAGAVLALSNAPPLIELTIQRSAPRLPGQGFDAWSMNRERTEVTGDLASVETAIVNLFSGRKTLFERQTRLPAGDFDFKLRLPPMETGRREELLRGVFDSVFGVNISRKSALRDVWVAKLIRTNVPGLSSPVPGGRGGGGSGPGRVDLGRVRIASVLGYFEDWLGKPVFDETGVTNIFDIHLRWEIPTAHLAVVNMDREIVDVLFSAEDEEGLSTEQKRILHAIQGKLPAAELASFPVEVQEEFRAIAAELGKPEEQRFVPSEATLLAVARDLGIELTLERRLVEVLVVR